MSNEPEETPQTRVCKVCQSVEHLNESSEWTGPHATYCCVCEICEHRFTKHDVQIYSLDRKFVACNTCGLSESVSYYRLESEKWHECAETRLLKLNLFKSVMMNIDTMQAKANDPNEDQPSVISIRQRLTGIEKFSIEEMQWFLEMYELYTREIASQLSKKAIKEEIKLVVQDKTKAALQNEAKRQEKEKSVERKPAVKLNPREKAIRAMMKTLNKSEKDATAMYDEMMKGISK